MLVMYTVVYMTMRVSDQTKDRLLKIQELYGFSSLNDVVLHLIETSGLVRSKLYGWLKDLMPYGTTENYVLFNDEEDDDVVKTHIYTESKRYYIVAKKDGSYLGAQYSPLLSLPEQGGRGGGDLTDGKFNKETWEAIKSDIIRKELRPYLEIRLSA